jgi:hypothetical protein
MVIVNPHFIGNAPSNAPGCPGGILLASNGIVPSACRRFPDGSIIVGVTKIIRFFFKVCDD